MLFSCQVWLSLGMFRNFNRGNCGLHTVKDAWAQKVSFLLHLGNICVQVNIFGTPSNHSFLFPLIYLVSKNKELSFSSRIHFLTTVILRFSRFNYFSCHMKLPSFSWRCITLAQTVVISTYLSDLCNSLNVCLNRNTRSLGY